MRQPKKQVTKKDILTICNQNMLAHRVLLEKFNGLDMLFAEFIEFLGNQKEFEKFLDGKYKQKKRKRSWRSITNSK